mmetsp:Transcript_11621/g.14007  ORF Transcript_11621/g.14007 Transcript_11621/m.14007 type:complete len:476 (-) Transcript_11621:116-1543(-)
MINDDLKSSNKMKPAPPTNAAMFGSRRATSDTPSEAPKTNPKPSKFITNAEQQWYAMMASKSSADESWAAQEKPAIAPKVIASPHSATQFRTPGAAASSVPRGHVNLRPPGSSSGPSTRPPPNSAPSPMRVARVNQGREVNSKTEAKPVPGQAHSMGMVSRPGARPPPPNHPATMMRKLNGMPTSKPVGQRPPPPSMRKRMVPGMVSGMVPRPRGPPPPEVLARLRARGPPGHSKAHPNHPSRQPPSSANKQNFNHTSHVTTLKQRPSSSSKLAASTNNKKDGSQLNSNIRPTKLTQGAQTMLTSKPNVPIATTLHPVPTPVVVADMADSSGIPDSLDSLDQTMSETQNTVTANHGEIEKEEWVQLWDEEVESNYYYNQLTGEASWIRPEELGAELESGAGGGGDSTVSSMGGSTCLDGNWERYWDEDAAAHYLHNTTTGETRWESDHHEDGVNAIFSDTTLEFDSLTEAQGKDW